MKKKDIIITRIAYLVLNIVTIFGVVYTIYITNADGYERYQTENALLGFCAYIFFLVMNYIYGTMKYIDFLNRLQRDKYDEINKGK